MQSAKGFQGFLFCSVTYFCALMIYHIVVGDEAARPLAEAVATGPSMAGEVVVMKDILHVGPLQRGVEQSFSALRSKWWQAVAPEAKPPIEVDDLERLLGVSNELYKDSDAQAWCWMAPGPADVCAYYWMLPYLGKHSGRLFIVNMANLPFLNEAGKVFYPKSISELLPKEIIKARRLARPVTATEIEMDVDAWHPIVAENAGIRTLVMVLVGAGLAFGGTEVAVTAAADGLDRTAAAGPLLGLWGLGGLLGGLAAARAGGGARTGAGLAMLLAALGVTHAALAATAGSFVALAPAIVVAGALIAPTCATAYAMVDEAAPHGTVTEAFAWMATAVAIGTSLGAAAAGAVADAGGPAPAFLLAGAPAVLLALLAATRAHTLSPAVDPMPVPAARPVTV